MEIRKVLRVENINKNRVENKTKWTEPTKKIKCKGQK